jgi:hypothetical protein
MRNLITFFCLLPFITFADYVVTVPVGNGTSTGGSATNVILTGDVVKSGGSTVATLQATPSVSNVVNSVLGPIVLLGSIQPISTGNLDIVLGSGSLTGNSVKVGNVTAAALIGDGSAVSNLNASSLASGIIPNAQLSTNVVITSGLGSTIGQIPTARSDGTVGWSNAPAGGSVNSTNANYATTAGHAGSADYATSASNVAGDIFTLLTNNIAGNPVLALQTNIVTDLGGGLLQTNHVFALLPVPVSGSTSNAYPGSPLANQLGAAVTTNAFAQRGLWDSFGNQIGYEQPISTVTNFTATLYFSDTYGPGTYAFSGYDTVFNLITNGTALIYTNPISHKVIASVNDSGFYILEAGDPPFETLGGRYDIKRVAGAALLPQNDHPTNFFTVINAGPWRNAAGTLSNNPRSVFGTNIYSVTTNVVTVLAIVSGSTSNAVPGSPLAGQIAVALNTGQTNPVLAIAGEQSQFRNKPLRGMTAIDGQGWQSLTNQMNILKTDGWYAYGYNTLCGDFGWNLYTNIGGFYYPIYDSNMNFQWATNYPSGAATGDAIHALGFKFGLWLDSGEQQLVLSNFTSQVNYLSSVFKADLLWIDDASGDYQFIAAAGMALRTNGTATTITGGFSTTPPTAAVIGVVNDAIFHGASDAVNFSPAIQCLDNIFTNNSLRFVKEGRYAGFAGSGGDEWAGLVNGTAIGSRSIFSAMCLCSMDIILWGNSTGTPQYYTYATNSDLLNIQWDVATCNRVANTNGIWILQKESSGVPGVQYLEVLNTSSNTPTTVSINLSSLPIPQGSYRVYDNYSQTYLSNGVPLSSWTVYLLNTDSAVYTLKPVAQSLFATPASDGSGLTNVTASSVASLLTNNIVFTSASLVTNTLGYDGTALVSSGTTVVLKDRYGNTLGTVGTVGSVNEVIPMRSGMILSGTSMSGVIY